MVASRNKSPDYFRKKEKLFPWFAIPTTKQPEPLNELKSMENLIRFRDSTGFVHFAPEEILRLQGDGNYTQVVLADGRKLLLSKTISYLLELMPEGMLLRISKSHAINPVYLESVFLRRRQRYVCLASGEKLEISWRKAREMRKQSKKP